jgi:transcriptional regulator of met regulon
VATNIPFNKLSNTIFRSFLEKHTDKSIPFEATLRKRYFDDIYNQVMDKMRIEIGNNQIWVTVDETCDVQGRS